MGADEKEHGRGRARAGARRKNSRRRKGDAALAAFLTRPQAELQIGARHRLPASSQAVNAAYIKSSPAAKLKVLDWARKSYRGTAAEPRQGRCFETETLRGAVEHCVSATRA